MSEIVCQVGNQAGQVELIWSSHGGFFRPYVISGQQLTELRRAADRSATGSSTSEKPSCREALETLVFALNGAGAGPPPWEPSYELAEAGFRLFNASFRRRTRRPKGPPLAGGPAEAVGVNRPGGRRRGAVGRREDTFSPCRGTWSMTSGLPNTRPPSRRDKGSSGGGRSGRPATT